MAEITQFPGAKMDAPMQARYEPTVSLGQIGTMLAVVLTGLGIYGATYKSLQDSVEMRVKYVPKIEALELLSSQTTERLSSQGLAILQMRDTDIKTAEALAKIAVDIAVIKTVVEREGDKVPMRN